MNPILFFDSGVGGLSVLRAVAALLPTAPLAYAADNAGFPRADVGDLVAVFQAGAYGASASPGQFLGHGPAREMLV